MTADKPYGPFKIFLASLMAGLKQLFVSYPQPEFPKQLGDYHWVSNITKHGPKKSYPIALYHDHKGEKAFAKLSSSRIKGYHYHSLKNEINLYTALNSVIVRTKYSQIKIPQLLKVAETSNHLLMLIEFIDGQTAESLSPRQKVKLYFQVTDSLGTLGNLMNTTEKSLVSKRSPLDIAFLHPLLLFRSIVNYPTRALDLIKCSLVFFRNFRDLKKTFSYRLVHRDLHFANVILKGKRTTLIDLQQCVFTDPIQEHVTLLRYFWKDGNFYKLFLKKLHALIPSHSDPHAFQALMSNSVIHGLTDKAFSAETIANWFDFLNYAVNYG
ncbi:phosphotransferase [Candidatus Amesbacteria bacterium]|nr:phosphotransferase [Candidatus Amesbacteria bacterium]